MGKYPGVDLYLRADNGFVVPELFELAEHNSCSYAVRLKINKTLLSKATFLSDELDHLTVKIRLITQYVMVSFSIKQEADLIPAVLLLRWKNHLTR